MLARFCLFFVISFFAAQQTGLASESSGNEKPIFILVFDKNCHTWCNMVRPFVKELQQEYGDRLEFAELDVTQSVLPETKKTAKGLKVEKYVDDFADNVPLVAAFTSRRSLIKELVGPKSKADYKKLIEIALQK